MKEKIIEGFSGRDLLDTQVSLGEDPSRQSIFLSDCP